MRGSLINIFFGSALGKTSAGGLASLRSALLSRSRLMCFGSFPPPVFFRDTVYTWIESGSFQVKLSFQVDALTAVMLLIVTGIGFLIHVYSLGYMGMTKA